MTIHTPVTSSGSTHDTNCGTSNQQLDEYQTTTGYFLSQTFMKYYELQKIYFLRGCCRTYHHYYIFPPLPNIGNTGGNKKRLMWQEGFPRRRGLSLRIPTGKKRRRPSGGITVQDYRVQQGPGRHRFPGCPLLLPQIRDEGEDAGTSYSFPPTTQQ